MGRAWGAPPSPRTRAAMASVVSAVAILALLAGATSSIAVQRASPSPASPPVLVIVNASTNPASPHEGDIASVAVTIANHGGSVADAATLDLIDTRPGGSVVPIGQTHLALSLSPGAFTEVSAPSFVAVGVGEHTLTIQLGNVSPSGGSPGDDSLSIPMTVNPASGPSQSPPPAGGLGTAALVGIGFTAILLIIVAAALLGFTVVRSRPPEIGPLDPPPPEPPDRSPPPLRPP